jgi:5-methylcytosine-specific restriction endonuclease McrA
LLGSWLGMLTGLMVLALLRRQLVTPARAARTAQLCRPLACRHALARSVCTSSEADGDGETAAVLPSVKRSELTEPMKKRVAYQQRYVCAGCDDLLPPNYEVDHIIPLALGGTNGLRNLQALCVPCHAQKTRDQRHAILAARKPPPPPQQPAADGESAEAVRGAASEGGAASTPQPGMEVENGLAPMADGEAQEGAHDRRGESPAVSPSPPRLSLSPSSPPPPPPPSSQLLSPVQLLQGMNRQQLAAVLATRGPVRLSAGPGTGKTRVLVAHIAHLVRAG